MIFVKKILKIYIIKIVNFIRFQKIYPECEQKTKQNRTYIKLHAMIEGWTHKLRCLIRI